MAETPLMPIRNPRSIYDFSAVESIRADKSECKDCEQETKISISPTAVQKFINIFKGHKLPDTKLDLPPREENTSNIGQKLQLLKEQKLIL